MTDLKVGDILTVSGDAVPKCYQGNKAFWRVQSINHIGLIVLDGPFEDEHLSVRLHTDPYDR